MSAENDVLEAPNWLSELEQKRENRVKAKLGHEAGAGAPCLKCDDKCPGLDLHFWRKICKNCKCAKEDHDVHDDDIYGWAQFQLLGSKPNKIKTKIVLPGKKDEVELEWAPKGSKETIDRYLKTLPPESLPVKGSDAAQARKHLLQKQIPIHDIDPTLCHELTELELKKMEDYVEHMKTNSVGVGQVVQFELNRGNLHLIGQANAAFVSNRFPKAVPSIETVQLQGERMTGNLVKQLDNLDIKDQKELDAFFDRVPKPANMAAFSENYSSGYEANKNEENIAKIKTSIPVYLPENINILSEQQRAVQSRDWQAPTHKYGQSDVTGEKQAPNLNLHTANTAPHYAAGHYNIQNDHQHPVSVGNVRDLALSTYDPNSNYSCGSTQILTNPKSYNSVSTDVSNFPNYSSPSAQLPNYHNPSNQPNYPSGPVTVSNQTNSHSTSAQASNPAAVGFGNSDLANSNRWVPSATAQIPNSAPVGYANSNIVNFQPSDGRVSNELPKPSSGYLNSNFANSNYSLPSYTPSNYKVPENHLVPNPVNIGAINDITYNNPEVKTAAHGDNPFDNKSGVAPYGVFGDDISIEAKCCKKCSQLFQPQDFAIFVERSSSLYHSECFKCAGCNQDLADMVYFYDQESDNVYCGRDYAKIRGIPRCKACDELIFVKEYCLAENSAFHVKHFCCFECDKALAGENYVVEDSQPLCLPCFETVKANQCEGCMKIIKPDEQGATLNEIHFHATDDCFVCKICRKPLLGGKLLLRNRKLYCSHDCFGKDNS